LTAFGSLKREPPLQPKTFGGQRRRLFQRDTAAPGAMAG